MLVREILCQVCFKFELFSHALLIVTEGHTDRHNMMLFLLQDTLRTHPSGFEKRRRNIFDPEEDNTAADDELDAESKSSSASADEVDADDTKETSYRSESSTNGENGNETRTTCQRTGCSHKPRFDSLFCSDSCGVITLEKDLLRTFQYTSDIHPSLLRN